MVTIIIVLLLCFRPAVRAMCPNNAVAVFQPWTGTAPYLGSITNFTFYSNPPALPVSKTFMDIFIFTLYPTAPLSFAFLLVSPISCTRSPLPLPSRINLKLDIYRTCQPLPFVSSTHAVCLRVTPCNMNVLPPPYAALGLIISSWCTMFWDLISTYCTLIVDQWKWIMVYGFTIGSPIFSKKYLLLRYAKGKDLSQCQKTGVILFLG